MKVYEMAAGYIDKITNYDTDIKVREGYWANIGKLYNEFERLRAKNKTSYSIISCFDFVFKCANDLYACFGAVYKGNFAVDGQTVARAMKEIVNK